jgi:hypothetical protein
VDYFLEEDSEHIPLLSSYYVSHEDPLLKELNFYVGGGV